MTVLTPSRHIACDDVFNVRDLGGYEAAGGRRVRWRVLYRADALHRLGPTSATVLEPLGWRTVLDLRTVGEVAGGAYRRAGVEVVHLPLLHRLWDREAVEDASDPVEFLVDRYFDMLAQGGPAIAAAVEIIASPARNPTVFHCTAGKDRTGVLAAVILSLLGVADVDVAEDYGLSALAMVKLVEWQRAQPEGGTAMVVQPTAILACPPQAMLAFLTRVREQFGSVEGYVREVGVPASTVSRLRHVLLER